MDDARAPIGDDREFPTDLAADEAGAGFSVGVIKNPKAHYGGPWEAPPKQLRAVVLDLGDDRRAVKMLSPLGGTVYAIWNAAQRPVDDVAHSVAALLMRYPGDRRVRRE